MVAALLNHNPLCALISVQPRECRAVRSCLILPPELDLLGPDSDRIARNTKTSYSRQKSQWRALLVSAECNLTHLETSSLSLQLIMQSPRFRLEDIHYAGFFTTSGISITKPVTDVYPSATDSRHKAYWTPNILVLCLSRPAPPTTRRLRTKTNPSMNGMGSRFDGLS